MADFHILEAAAASDSRLSRFDARLKVIIVIVAITVNLFSLNILAPLLVAGISLGSLTVSGIPLRLIRLRLGLPIVMAVIIFLTQLFLYGESVIGKIDVLGLTLSMYSEGLDRGLLIIGRVIGGAALVVWLSLSTPVEQLIGASRWFRIPKIIVEIMALMYRFIFVLLEEVIAIRQAQHLRLGYTRWRTGIKSISILAANLFFRAYDRADKVFEAMSLRGYSGNLVSVNKRVLSTIDYVWLSLALSLLIAIYFIGRVAL
ncbi:MAG: cobalt ECF transporter T component CbiQ [Dehalogenimonas sp.]|uniref:Cobalt ECF transporter T component CbiQ n=1 Tax=Candidatus Dehalogenimonas loeffleri TaxID=3127115 RepID=A0ABZ2J852_9CHLR|nr:cobalt ECF transporter T component CbiQ [Dehalogenimonas sp.]